MQNNESHLPMSLAARVTSRFVPDVIRLRLCLEKRLFLRATILGNVWDCRCFIVRRGKIGWFSSQWGTHSAKRPHTTKFQISRV